MSLGMAQLINHDLLYTTPRQFFLIYLRQRYLYNNLAYHFRESSYDV